MKLSTITAAVSLALLVGCANKGTIKNADLKPDTDTIRPKPVSSVFHRPEGTMIVNYHTDGKGIELVAKGTAAIAGNNAFSVEQAAQVATLRARRTVSEFIKNQVSTTRSVKVLSTTVQKSLEDTANGVADRLTVVEDKDFDAEGNPIVAPLVVDRSSAAVNEKDPNTNSEKVAQIVKESIVTNSTTLLKGLFVENESIDSAGRTVTVTVKVNTQTINAANELGKQMGNQ